MTTSSRLPDRVDPRRLAATQARLEGHWPLADLPRLASSLYWPRDSADMADARLVLDFGEDEQRRVVMDGQLSATVPLVCQRCLASVAWPIHVTVRLTMVRDDEAAAEVPRDREPLVLDDDSLAVGALVDDELILALPLAAHCNNNDCSRSEPAPREGGKRPDNPFAGLADWKRGN